MRNVLMASESAAEQAGLAVLANGGNATDAVVAAMLAGAAVASPASLLGSAVLLVAGPGMGAYRVDGRALAPGRGMPRPKGNDVPPPSWRGVVPRLMPAALTALARFGTMTVGGVARAASAAVRDNHSALDVRARLGLLEVLGRSGAEVLARAGVRDATLQLAGPTAGGLFSRDDLDELLPIAVDPLVALEVGEHELLVPAQDPPLRHPAAAPPATHLGAAVAGDKQGVMAVALWAHAPEAMPLGLESGVSLAALEHAPARGVTRRRPGTAVPMPMPGALLRHEGRCWAASAMTGTGELERAAARAVVKRLEQVGLQAGESLAGLVGSEATAVTVLGELLWLSRAQGTDALHEVREALRSG